MECGQAEPHSAQREEEDKNRGQAAEGNYVTLLCYTTPDCCLFACLYVNMSVCLEALTSALSHYMLNKIRVTKNHPKVEQN